MALYDNKFDWYDIFIPGSTSAAILQTDWKKKANDILSDFGKIKNKINGIEDQQNFNAQEAQKQRDWEERMSNTAHQRELQDFKAAGINPAITAMGGNGAATPNSAAASSGYSGGTLAGIGMIINSAANLIHAGKRTGDMQTTTQIYNSAGSLIKTIEKWTTKM